MTTPATDRPERMTVYVPRSLRRAVKIAAATDGVSITQWVSGALERALPAFTPAETPR